MATERSKPPKSNKRAKRKPTKKQSSAAIAIEKRRDSATKLKLSGWSYRDIAAHLNVSATLLPPDDSPQSETLLSRLAAPIPLEIVGLTFTTMTLCDLLVGLCGIPGVQN